MRPRRQPEIIAGRVNADGSIATGDGFVVTRAAAGIYNFTLPPGFRLISAVMTSASEVGYIDTWSAGGFRVITATAVGGAGADNPFSFIAVGVQQ